MYKINNSFENITRNNVNYNKIDGNRILIEDIKKMHLLPPYCANSLYNDKIDSNIAYSNNPNNDLNYKTKIVKNPRNNGDQIQIKNIKFYKDWKRDYTINVPDSDTIIENSSVKNKDSPSLKLYQETKRKDNFAKPMRNNGSNLVRDIYNDCMNEPTFQYTKYSSITPGSREWVNNPLYNDDISEETEALSTLYMMQIKDNKNNIYDSVKEDMEILNYNPHYDQEYDSKYKFTIK